jgi:hypothetical protein
VKTRTLTMPDLAMIAGTRMALGAGLGLLVASKLGDGARRGAGWALVALGAVTTIPLVMKVLAKSDGLAKPGYAA